MGLVRAERILPILSLTSKTVTRFFGTTYVYFATQRPCGIY